MTKPGERGGPTADRPRRPGFGSTVAAILALGLAAMTTIAGVVEGRGSQQPGVTAPAIPRAAEQTSERPSAGSPDDGTGERPREQPDGSRPDRSGDRPPADGAEDDTILPGRMLVAYYGTAGTGALGVLGSRSRTG